MSKELRFSFEKLDVFNVALRMVDQVDEVAAKLPTGRAYMRDQLRRASNSVVLNIAEGAGEFSPPEKARFYRMAKRSGTEVAAQLILASRLGLVDESASLEARKLVHRVVCMLAKMAKARA